MNGTNPSIEPSHFLIVDDHPLFREALNLALKSSFPGVKIDEAGSIAAAHDVLKNAGAVDLILLDLSLRCFDGFDGLISLRKSYPFVPILIVSGLEGQRLVHEALCLGAAGFVPKASGKAELRRAIDDVLGGGIYVPRNQQPSGAKRQLAKPEKSLADGIASLTPAQARVLAMIRRGMLNREIAKQLGVGESTVKTHVTTIFRKLGVISRTQVVIKTAQLDLDAVASARQ